MSTPSSEKRAVLRYQPKAGNYIEYAGRRAEIRDLSLEGVYVFDPDPFPAGSEMDFALRAGETDILLQGVVQRSTDGEGMAIQFVNVSSESNRRLRIHLASLFTFAGVVAK